MARESPDVLGLEIITGIGNGLMDKARGLGRRAGKRKAIEFPIGPRAAAFTMEPRGLQGIFPLPRHHELPREPRGWPMENKDRYRRNAEECIRLARSAKPQHKATLLKMAETWRRLADEIGLEKPASRKDAD